ncbi:aldose 1-epimerase, putative [Ricinus communis]|uniref:glucose-6-phosphate 1-epimerase n=1 Tax=Ricinus communis TaxID=3988 RepID=B9SZ10_RICCO|nr:aldose 1-epimerase, putative [Ricinus communis]
MAQESAYKYVERCKGLNGLDKVILREVRGYSAEVYLDGGQVTSWKNEHGEELLFAGCKVWCHRYEFRLKITLGPAGDLMLTSRIRNTNTDGKPFTFTFSYQTYFAVSDISEVRVEGVETLDYLDNLQNRERFTEQGDAITFESEVDKIYISTPTKIAIMDHEKKRTFVLRKDGLPDAVVWNPWEKKAKAMPDFGDDEYKHMLRVDAACVGTPVTLKPGEEWRGRQELSAVPSSYCSKGRRP